MRVVIADTSPINYLIMIDCIDLLRRLYKRIVTPPEVFGELTNEGAPPEVAAWIESRPEWVEVRSPAINPHLPLAFTVLGNSSCSATVGLNAYST